MVVVSDLHLDKTTLGVSRKPEVELALQQATEHAIATRADAFVFLGDLADPDSRGATLKAIDVVCKAALRLSRARIMSIWIAGNHDVEEDGSGATTLTPLLGLESASSDDWVLDHGAEEAPIFIAEGPRLIPVIDAQILCLPYTAVSRTYDPAVVAESAFQKGGPVIVAAHLMIPGIVPGSETTEMPRGRAVTFPVRETTQAVVRMNGHYHLRQDFDPGDGGAPIHIPGAPVPFAFGEEGNPSAFSVIKIRTGVKR